MRTLKKHPQIHNKSKILWLSLQTTQITIHVYNRKIRNYKIESHACQEALANVGIPKNLM
jgi:hypothetical protein